MDNFDVFYNNYFDFDYDDDDNICNNIYSNRNENQIIASKKITKENIYKENLIYKNKSINIDDNDENFDESKIETAYLDRMKSWDVEKFNKASKAIKCNPGSFYRVIGKSVKDIEKFLYIYNGYRCTLIEVYESVGYDGYHYTCLKWIKK